MSTETDTSGEERVLRLLDDEGARWRAGYQPPSFDDAVRRLALPGDEGARVDDPHEAPVVVGARRTGWWRPVLVAAAALVLVGGVVGVALRSGSVHGVPADGPGGTPRLTAPPAGFRLVEGVSAAGGLDATASPSSAAGSTTVTYVGPRAFASGEHETLALTVSPTRQPLVDVSNDSLGAGRPGLVRGQVATVRTGDCAQAPSCQVIQVSWAEREDEGVTVSYAGPYGGVSGSLGFSEVMAAAESFDDGRSSSSSSEARPTGEAALPREVISDGRLLVLWSTRRPDGLMLDWDPVRPTTLSVFLPRPPSGPVTYCDPVEIPFLTAQNDQRVEVTLGRYVSALPTQLHPCPAVAPSQRFSQHRSVVLDEPLMDRRVVDGSTGQPLGVGTSLS